MAESEVVICRKHPKQSPQPGVCPSCLRERLSKIAGNSKLLANNNCSSNSPSSFSGSPDQYNNHYYYSSGGYSPAASTRCRRRGHQRVASDVMDSIYLAISGLKKSRSVAAFASRSNNYNINGGLMRSDGVINNRKKKGGFWNKLLLKSTSKKLANF